MKCRRTYPGDREGFVVPGGAHGRCDAPASRFFLITRPNEQFVYALCDEHFPDVLIAVSCRRYKEIDENIAHVLIVTLS